MGERPFGWQTIHGVDREHDTPYLTRIWIGRLRLHIFHRGDADPDCHDHPWDFWTFPLTPYVEEVISPALAALAARSPITRVFKPEWDRKTAVVRAWRWHYRKAEHCHRVLGRHSGWQTHNWGSGQIINPPAPLTDHRRIVTIVWRGRAARKWGFLKNRDGQWCWTPWRDYVFGGGKHVPCQPQEDRP